jgi:hypothetical protein
MKRGCAIAIFGIILLLSGGCSDETAQPPGQGQIRMHLTDSPAQFDAVNIVVTGVEVHQAGADSTSGWITVNSISGTYDLLSLANGLSVVLVDSSLPAGHYTQIRLLIGAGSNVVIGGVSFDLEIPSGMQTGLKLNHQFTIESNVLYELTLDFDAERSIILTGVGQYQLQPVIRVQANAVAGSISGTVLPIEAMAHIWTMVDDDTVWASADPSSGYFMLSALPEGIYAVTFVSTNVAYRDTTKYDVLVLRQQNTAIGTITMGGQ